MGTSLIRRLKDAPAQYCKYGRIFNDLDQETRDFITERSALPEGHPQRLSRTQLCRVLRSENYDIAATTIREHYLGICCCTKSQEQ